MQESVLQQVIISSYNGYKVYWQDGSQVVTPHDEGVIAEFKKLTDYSSLQHSDFSSALEQGKVCYCDDELDEAYLKKTATLSYLMAFQKNIRWSIAPSWD